MISQEQSKGSNEFFFGKHISKYKIKKAFGIKNLPNYSGIGIVQPFYFDFRRTLNIMAVAALLICLIQLYVVTSRTNKQVFEKEVNFTDVKDKEMVSESFELSGGSAPLKVEISSNVDNSWANVGLSLVNEATNEIAYTSKDIEEYHGYEDGESWSEGSQNSEFNFCGVAAGKYHFLISAEKQETLQNLSPSTYISPDGDLSLSRDASGTISVTNTLTMETTGFGNSKQITADTITALGKLVRETLGRKDIDSILNANVTSNISTPTVLDNRSVKIKAEWLPVSFWNFAIVIIVLVVFVGACYLGRKIFESSKWANSSNSPYPQS
jgi:hypothetical protein